MTDTLRMEETLHQIAGLASAVFEGDGRGQEPSNAAVPEVAVEELPVGCTIRSVPPRLAVKAAGVARKVNPVNAPFAAALTALEAEAPLPMRIAVMTTKYWGPRPRKLTVSFMEKTASDLRARIVQHMNAWSKVAGISFVETQRDGDVRVSRQPGGYWSYLGTDILLIPKNRQTMNLERFTMATPDGEYKRVIRHETGHTLGFPHEHMRRELVARIDPQKAYAYFLRTQGWDKQTVDAQVLTPLDQASIMATPADQTSIMCYQLPGAITKDGQPIRGGLDINKSDYEFAAKIYPKPGHALEQPEATPELAPEAALEFAPDWGEENDPEIAIP